MKSPAQRGARSLFFALLFLLCAGCAGASGAGASRDILWKIVSSCVETGAADYCATCMAPQVGTPCAAGKKCQETTEVWAKNQDFVALRDRKMCGCPDEFVHGLALPRTRVTGVEDPLRPDGIWQFAWALACDKIGDDSVASLAVNPAGMRDQDQLHVHIARLLPDARQRFRADLSTRVARLDEVWSAAGRLAAAAGLADYGVLVAHDPKGGFTVLIDQESPEKDFTVVRCQ